MLSNLLTLPSLPSGRRFLEIHAPDESQGEPLCSGPEVTLYVADSREWVVSYFRAAVLINNLRRRKTNLSLSCTVYINDENVEMQTFHFDEGAWNKTAYLAGIPFFSITGLDVESGTLIIAPMEQALVIRR